MDEQSKTPLTQDKINESLVQTLNGLIFICREGYNGYMQAADGITSSAYKTMFAEYALQRSRFASQLANLVTDYKGDAGDDGHAMSIFPRSWTGIDSVVMGGDYGAIFSECERSEDVAKNAYERVLEEKLTGDVAKVVNQQYTQ